MYQSTSSYHPDVTHIYPQNLVGNMTMGSNFQIPLFLQQSAQQVLPYPRISSTAIANTLGTTQLQTTSPMSLYEFKSQQSTPQMKNAQLQNCVPPLALENDVFYNCNFVGQLQGTWEIDTRAGPDQLSIIVPNVIAEEEQYAIVRRVCNDGDALPDQFIYDEPTRFILCTVDGQVEAFLRKGSNMKFSVMWTNASDGSQTFWRRKGDVTFNLVSVDSLISSRRNSICSIGSSSTGRESNIDSSGIGSGIVPTYVRPEPLQKSGLAQSIPPLMKVTSDESLTTNSPLPKLNNNIDFLSSTNDVEQEAIFELMKAHCEGNKELLKKMVHWALTNCAANRVSSEKISEISEGRLWITAHATDSTEDDEIEESFQESLDDIKGAYREVRPGVYKQPEPQLNEPGVQHRLLKDSNGCWKIEGYDVDSGKWELCAKELPNGRWVDIKTDEKIIQVQLLPMSKILHKMKEELEYENQKVAKSMEFLFTSCNQKKLNSKLKGRNLKHNISNLKQKLEKQYYLSFAVQVATTADTIAQELEVL
jgi:hypothetical protein